MGEMHYWIWWSLDEIYGYDELQDPSMKDMINNLILELFKDFELIKKLNT